MPVWLSKMVLAQHFCTGCRGWYKAHQTLTPAIDWLDSLIGADGLLNSSSTKLQWGDALLKTNWFANKICMFQSCFLIIRHKPRFRMSENGCDVCAECRWFITSRKLSRFVLSSSTNLSIRSKTELTSGVLSRTMATSSFVSLENLKGLRMKSPMICAGCRITSIMFSMTSLTEARDNYPSAFDPLIKTFAASSESDRHLPRMSSSCLVGKCHLRGGGRTKEYFCSNLAKLVFC
jgi:hypothetical protein